MKKVISAIIATFVMGIALPIFAAESVPELHMNFRFMQTTDNTGALNQPSESRIGLHTVEISAKQEVDNVGGYLLYRIADQSYTNGKQASESYPVEAKVYYTSGAYKVTAGLQFVPFGIYKWDNLYNPFLDIPGQKGQTWDSDWGLLGTYDAKPVTLDLGYWKGAAERLGRQETSEKDILTARIGYDILKNLNGGISFMDGKVSKTTYTVGAFPVVADSLCPGSLTKDCALTKKRMYAVDGTWGIVPNLQGQLEYVNYKFSPSVQFVDAEKGNYGLMQLKYDIVRVPSPLNKISPVLQYSWDNDKVTPVGGVSKTFKTKNYGEELWAKAGKNLDIFLQFSQQKYSSDVAGLAAPQTEKKSVLALKYSFQ
jgi:hypothetical protein